MGFTASSDRRSVLFHGRYFGNLPINIGEALPRLDYSVRLQRSREDVYDLCVPRFKPFLASTSQRTCSIDPGVRKFITLYDPEGRVFSIGDPNKEIMKRLGQVDGFKRKLASLEKSIVPTPCQGDHCPCKSPCSRCTDKKKCTCLWKCKTRSKVAMKKKDREHTPEVTKYKRQRHRLRKKIRFLYRKVTRMIQDLHQKVSKWLSENYREVLLPSFQTSEMVAKYAHGEARDVTPSSLLQPVEELTLCGRKRKIRSVTVRAMLAQAHYKFKMLLKYKMARTLGRVQEVGEEYTSKTCSGCGFIDHAPGSKETYTCKRCGLVQDRDTNAAKNIFHKNVDVSILREHFTGGPTSGSPVSSLA